MLLAIAVALGARHVRGWSSREERFSRNLPRPPEVLVNEMREKIISGDDPLGEFFCKIRPPEQRMMHQSSDV